MEKIHHMCPCFFAPGLCFCKTLSPETPGQLLADQLLTSFAGSSSAKVQQSIFDHTLILSQLGAENSSKNNNCEPAMASTKLQSNVNTQRFDPIRLARKPGPTERPGLGLRGSGRYRDTAERPPPTDGVRQQGEKRWRTTGEASRARAWGH